jgi:hypothetical protein
VCVQVWASVMLVCSCAIWCVYVHICGLLVSVYALCGACVLTRCVCECVVCVVCMRVAVCV